MRAGGGRRGLGCAGGVCVGGVVNFSFYLPECDAAGTGDEHYPCPHAPGGSATIQALDSGDRVPVGTMVTLIARPDDGFYVEGWNHAACLATGDWQNAGAEKRCVLSATGDLNVTVTFALFSANGRSAHSRTSQVIVSYKGWTDNAARSIVRTGHILIRSGILEDLGVISNPSPTSEVEEVLAGIRMTLLGERRGLQVLRMTSTVPYFWGRDSATGKFGDFTFSGVRRDSPLWSHLATVGVAAAVCDELSDGWRIPSLSELAGMFSDGSGSIPLDRAAGNMELDQAVAGARSGMIIPLGRDVAAGDFAALSEGSTTYETASRNLDGVYKAARPVSSGAIRFPGAADDRRMLCVRGERAQGVHYMSAVRLESGGKIIGSPAATLSAQTVAFTVTTTLSATQFDGTDVFTGTVVSWRHKDAPEAMSNADAGVPSARTAGEWGGFALNSSPSPDGTGLRIQVRAPSTRPPPTGDDPADLIRLSARLNPGAGATVTAVFMVKVEPSSVPAAPGSVFAALNADESVSLSWTPPAETGVTIIGYDILREQNGSDVFVSVGFSPGTGTIHTDASPPPLATLRYKTRARSTVDFGPVSEASNPVETPQFFRIINYGAPPGGAGGTVTVSGVESGESLPIGTTATFTATPAAGWYVEGWNRADCADAGSAANPGEEKECILTANTDLFVTAIFAVARAVVYGKGMSASLAADGGGTVSSGDTFADGTTIAFYAAPPENYVIAGWTNNDEKVCGGQNPCLLTANTDLFVTVYFAMTARVKHGILPKDGRGGTLTVAGLAGEDFAYAGATLTFTATPADGWTLAAWEGDVGDCAAPDLECALTVAAGADLQATARFAENCAAKNRLQGELRLGSESAPESCGACLDDYGEFGKTGDLCAAKKTGDFGGIAQKDVCLELRKEEADSPLQGNGRVCSGVDVNDTFCVLDSADALPCRGLFRHVLKCNVGWNRRALNPFFCGASCENDEKAVGGECRSVPVPAPVGE